MKAISKNALWCASQYTDEQLFKKGPDGVKQQIKKARRAYNEQEASLVNVKVESRRETKDFAGQQRRRAPTTLNFVGEVLRVGQAVAAPFTKVAKTRGNKSKDQKWLRAAVAQVRQRLKENKESSRHRGRKRRMTEREKRRAEERRILLHS